MPTDVALDFVGTPQFLSLSGKHLSVGCVGTGTTRLVGALAEVSVGSMLGTGTGQSDANILSYVHNVVAGSTGASGVKLPASAVAGRKIYVLNRGDTGAVKVYPPSSGKINLLAANASVTVNSAASACFIAEGTSDRWFTCSE